MSDLQVPNSDHDLWLIMGYQNLTRLFFLKTCITDQNYHSIFLLFIFVGDHCEKTITIIDRRNRGSRLLEEPFWIGIIVVLGVLAVTGMVVLIRKKFLPKCNCNCCLGMRKTSSNAGKGALPQFKPIEKWPDCNS